MATEYEKQLDEAQNRYDTLSSISVDSRTGRYTVDGRAVSAAEYKKIVASAKKELDTAKKLVRAEKAKTFTSQQKTASAQKKQKAELDALKKERDGLLGFNAVDANKIARGWVQDPEFVQQKIDERARRIAEIDRQLGTTTSEGAAPRSTITDGRTTSGRTPTQPATTTQATQPTTKTETPAATTTRTTTTTRRTGKGGKATTVTIDGKKVKVGGEKWKEIIQEEFGSLWDVYNNSADVRKVIDLSVQEGWYNDATQLTARLQNTNWYRTTENSARQFAIRQSTDPATLQDEIAQKTQEIRDASRASGVVLADTTINKLAMDAVKFGWSAVETSNAVGSEAVAVARAGGPRAMSELSRSTIGATLRQYADQYAIKPSDAFIEDWTAKVLTGQGDQKQYEDLVREQARTLYRSLAPQIDKGLDVKTAVAAYTNQARNILGIDETQIDWTSDKWNRALNYQDPKTGEYRQMDTWEWNRYLRQQPEWQETDDAKQLYRQTAFTLAQAFGRTT